jgi:hypothetical protein
MCNEKLNFHPSSELMSISREENDKDHKQEVINTYNLDYKTFWKKSSWKTQA